MVTLRGNNPDYNSDYRSDYNTNEDLVEWDMYQKNIYVVREVSSIEEELLPEDETLFYQGLRGK